MANICVAYLLLGEGLCGLAFLLSGRKFSHGETSEVSPQGASRSLSFIHLANTKYFLNYHE